VCFDVTQMNADRRTGEMIDRSHESASARSGTKFPRSRRAFPPPPKRRETRRSQRWRLAQAMIELSARAGHQEVSIAELCAGAGVSPVTFYEQFHDKEDVLVNAYRACAESIFGEVRAAVADGEISKLPRVALGALLQAVASDPDAGRILFIEALSGGERMGEERTRVFGRFERRVRDYLEHLPRQSSTPDVPVVAVVGALRHIVARHLRNNAGDELPSRSQDGLAWLYSYSRAPGSERWSTSPGALLSPPAQLLTPARERAPERLPPGNHGLPAGLVARHQRTRLIYAIAEVTMERGYANARIDEIVARAHVAKPVFYRHFTDKQHAFLEAQQYPTQFILDRCAEAYFSADQWPERMWRMLNALIEMINQSPAISHLRLVECYSAGPEAIRRAEEITRSFTIFLQEGYRQRPQAAQLPRLCSQAITGAIFEIIQRHVADNDPVGLAARLPQLTYIATAPFTGADEAIALMEEIKDRDAAAQTA
jgi:AcrR family transcriptional regulator